MARKKKTPESPTAEPTAKVKRGSSIAIKKDVAPGENKLEVPSTYHEWVDNRSMILAGMDIHIYTLDDHTDAMMEKLEVIAEEECAKIAVLLRSRLKARSKKLGMGCRLT